MSLITILYRFLTQTKTLYDFILTSFADHPFYLNVYIAQLLKNVVPRCGRTA